MAERIQGENQVVLSGMIGRAAVYRKVHVFPESNNDGSVEVVDRATQPCGPLKPIPSQENFALRE